MRLTFTRLLAVIAVVVGCLLVAAPAVAHNSLASVDPSDRSVVPVGSDLVLRFVNEVPLATMSVTVTDAADRRTEITALRHGESARDVVVSLAGVSSGPVTLRWRLVGPDGHVVTDRLKYRVGVADGSGAGTSTPPTATPPASEPDDVGGSTVASAGRWLVRLASYLALLAAVGVLVTARFVWPGAWRHPRLRSVPPVALAAVAALALVQLAQLAATIEQRPWWQALGSLDVAIGTDVGEALLIRLVVAAAGALLLARGVARLGSARGDLVLGTIVVVLALTWAMAGHARSLRWSVAGVPLDVLHHLAAATWLGGLAIVGGFALRTLDPAEARPVVANFSRIAGGAVAVLAVTGLLATARFVDSPGALVDAHSRLLAVKLAVVALMLAAGNVNRQRVLRWTARPGAPRPRQVWALRRAMTTELVLGAVVLAVTAGLVVTTPAA